MKTNSRSLNAKIGLAIAASFVLLLLAGTASAQWTTNGTNISNTNSGNVGIGTATPNYTLGVSSGSAQYAVPAINILASTHATSKRATIGFGLTSAGTAGWSFGQDRNGNGTRDMYP